MYITATWQPMVMAVGAKVKLRYSTCPTAEVWLARICAGVTGPSWNGKEETVSFVC